MNIDIVASGATWLQWLHVTNLITCGGPNWAELEQRIEQWAADSEQITDAGSLEFSNIDIDVRWGPQYSPTPLKNINMGQNLVWNFPYFLMSWKCITRSSSTGRQAVW